MKFIQTENDRSARPV